MKLLTKKMTTLCIMFSTIFPATSSENKPFNTEIRCRKPHCRKRFKSLPNRRQHERDIHEKSVQYKCYFCKYKTTRRSTLHAEHMRRMHKAASFSCTDCKWIFPTREQRREHQYERHGKFCCKCATMFYSRSEWLEHEKQCLQTQEVEQDFRDFGAENCSKLSCFFCLCCLRAFNSKSDLEDHRQHDCNTDE